MVALDPLEQMNPESLELVGADAGDNRRPRLLQIALEELLGKIVHGEPGRHHRPVEKVLVANDGHGRMELVRLAAQRQQLLARGGYIGWLGETIVAQRQRLV